MLSTMNSFLTTHKLTAEVWLKSYSLDSEFANIKERREVYSPVGVAIKKYRTAKNTPLYISIAQIRTKVNNYRMWLLFLSRKKSVSGRQDSNLRPHAPKARALAIWATPRIKITWWKAREANHQSASGGNRTHTLLRERDFKSRASTSSATEAETECDYTIQPSWPQRDDSSSY